jgi:hypothetical protein
MLREQREHISSTLHNLDLLKAERQEELYKDKEALKQEREELTKREAILAESLDGMTLKQDAKEDDEKKEQELQEREKQLKSNQEKLLNAQETLEKEKSALLDEFEYAKEQEKMRTHEEKMLLEDRERFEKEREEALEIQNAIRKREEALALKEEHLADALEQVAKDKKLLVDELEYAKKQHQQEKDSKEFNETTVRKLIAEHSINVELFHKEKELVENARVALEKDRETLTDISREKEVLDAEKVKFAKDQETLKEEAESLKQLRDKLETLHKEEHLEDGETFEQRLEIISLERNYNDERQKRIGIYLFIFIMGLIIGALFFSTTTEVIKPQTKTLYRSFKAYEQKAETTAKFYEHTITKGDNLYTLSQKLYEDSKFWPLIFVENMKSVNDMDKVYPGDVLRIPRIPEGSSAQEELAVVYIKAYKAYKRLGKDNDAHWLLYWGSQNIDPKLLHRYREDIASDDSERVKGYLKRFVLTPDDTKGKY